jgi:hypothetical protein
VARFYAAGWSITKATKNRSDIILVGPPLPPGNYTRKLRIRQNGHHDQPTAHHHLAKRAPGIHLPEK